MLHQLLNLDTHLFLFFNSAIANPVFNVVFPVITNGATWIVPGICAALAFLYFQKRKAIVVIVLSLITVSASDPVCNRLLKPLVPRLRPCDERVHINGAHFLIGTKSSPSFPSSHAMNMFAQAMLFTLLYRKKRVWITAFLFAATIGFSRIYVGVHYPLDVFAGAVCGVIIGGIVYFGYLFIVTKWNPAPLRL
jgi:undecaprenyl-diphosphatase